jgi:hypothetical protein
MNARAASIIIAAALLGASAVAQDQAAIPAGTVTCRVAGYDVVLSNEGPDTVPVGTVVSWDVPFARASGTVALAAELDAGGQAVLTAVLGSTYLAGPKPCSSEVLLSNPDQEETEAPPRG